MSVQFNFFEGKGKTNDRPEGLRYQPEFIDRSEEAALLARVRDLPFKEFEFHGYLGKRRVVSFGWQYEFSGSGRLLKADDIPEFLLELRTRAAEFAQMEPEALQHVLVIEYGQGAGIGWHRDKPVFGEVVGISLLAPCVLRFRRKIDPKGEKGNRKKGEAKLRGTRIGANWERFNLDAEPRSAYHLSGPARSEWEHSISSVEELRYSVTFRNVHEDENLLSL